MGNLETRLERLEASVSPLSPLVVRIVTKEGDGPADDHPEVIEARRPAEEQGRPLLVLNNVLVSPAPRPTICTSGY